MLEALLTIAALLVTPAGAGAAEVVVHALDPSGPADACNRCASRGVLRCGEHDKDDVALEEEVLFCSHLASCEDCGGTFWRDCPSCLKGAKSEEVAALRARLKARLDADPLAEHVGRPTARLETEHFRLVVETGPMRLGKKKLDQHQLGHVLARDVQAVADLMQGHFQVQEGEYAAKMRMWVWRSDDDHALVMRKFLRSTSTGDFKMLGHRPVFSVWTHSPEFDTAQKVRANFVHNAGHMLASNLFRALWVGDIGGGWFDAGLGHWYEYELMGRSTNACIEEAVVVAGGNNGEWRARLRKRLAKEKDPYLPRLTQTNTGGLMVEEQMLCWSFYDYLLHEHPGVLRDVLIDLKNKRPTREVFQQRLGVSLLQADELWRAWVKDVYPTRGDKPRR